MYQVQNQQSPVKNTGSCFRCHKPGHWANSCPDNPNSRSPVSRPITSDEQYPAIRCRCGAGLCEIKISSSVKNPNRKYYNCPGIKEMTCGFFKWCDELKREDIRELQPKRWPMCGCGAGICRVNVEVNGVDAGRSYFACHIKKGDGACNFRQWLDSSAESISVTPENPLEMELDAIETATCENPIEVDKVHVEGEEEEMLGKACGLPIATLEVHPPPIVNNGSFPNSIPIPENLPSLDAQPRVGLLSNTLSPLKDGLHEGGIMTSTILPAFENLALHLQNRLITVLEPMSPQNHETMTKEAESTFSALNYLQVDYLPFQLRVNEYIKQAASLAHIEQIIDGDTYQDLVDHYNDEQQRYVELSKSHQEAKEAFMASNGQLSLLCEQASCLDSSGELAIENAARWETFCKINKAMKECKERLQAASQKAEEALKISEKRDIEWRAAQVAFQTARARLRN